MITYLALFVSAMSACVTAYAAYFNSEKLRLDLYNKRFEVYSTTIDFYQALIKWDDTEQNQRIYLRFIKSFLESRFLFKADVYELLGKMRSNADIVISFKEHAATIYSGMPEEIIKEHKKMTEAMGCWNKNIDEVSQLMLRYLDFQELSFLKAIRSKFQKYIFIGKGKKSRH
jgi:hypothetical protein